MKKIFEAAGGYILNRNTVFNKMPIDLNINLDIERRGNLNKSLKSYHDLDTWQKELYNRVINRQDTLVNVNPAGGKTKPVVMAWEDSFTDYDHDKILWITPTVQLANQVFHVDLKESLFTLEIGQSKANAESAVKVISAEMVSFFILAS